MDFAENQGQLKKCKDRCPLLRSQHTFFCPVQRSKSVGLQIYRARLGRQMT